MIIRIMTTGILCLAAGINFAYEPKNNLWGYELEIEGYNYRYNEINSSDNSFFMRDKGPMYGINFATEKNLNTAWKLRFEYAFTVSNQIHYRSDGTGTMDNCDYNRLEMRALTSYNINPSWDTYFGLGYRNLQNDGTDKRTSTGHRAYLRDSRYVYLPLGIAYTMPYKPLNFSITTKAEYDHLLYARQYSAVNFTGTNIFGTYNRQKKGFGARVSIDGRQPGDQVDWLVGAFVRHWNFKNSEISGGGMEPKNRTFEIGAKVGIAF